MKKLVCLLFLSIPVWSQPLPVLFQEKPSENKVDVYVGEKLFTSLLFDRDQSIKKPVLYPVLSAGDHFVTRGWPLKPREGERTDHPHHVGIWFNLGDVNGNDFWNNSYERDHTKHQYGTIIFKEICKIKEGKKESVLSYTADWIDHKGEKLLTEETTYTFSATAKTRTIDRETTLIATKDVLIADNKEGMFAIRLARELEHPDPKMNYSPTGLYTNDLGQTGDEVWSKRSEWMKLTGTIENEEMTLAMFDHPKNHNFPGHWHARGYGLYAVNNLGSEAFTKGAEVSDLTLPEGEKTTFRNRLLIASKHLSDSEMDALAREFQR